MAEKARPQKGTPEQQSKLVIDLHPDCIIAEKATLTGDHPITVAANAIIHPFARIDSTAGPVSIEEGVIIWEKATAGGTEATATSRPIVIGRLTVIDALATVSPGCTVGHHCEIGVRAFVGPDCTLGNYVKITPISTISESTHLPDFTVVFGDPQQLRIDMTAKDNEVVRDLKEKNHMQHLETLKKLVKGINTKRP